MISLQALVALTLAALAAAIAAGLTLAAGHTWPAALLAAGTAGGGALGLVLKLVDRGDEP